MGFGDGFIEPLPLEPGRYRQGFLEYRVSFDGTWWRVDNHEFGGADGFDFTLEPRTIDTFAWQCHTLQTSPESAFVQTTVCERFVPEGLVMLRGAVLREVTAAGVATRIVRDADGYMRALTERFGLDVPEMRALWPDGVGQDISSGKRRCRNRAATRRFAGSPPPACSFARLRRAGGGPPFGGPDRTDSTTAAPAPANRLQRGESRANLRTREPTVVPATVPVYTALRPPPTAVRISSAPLRVSAASRSRRSALRRRWCSSPAGVPVGDAGQAAGTGGGAVHARLNRRR